MSDAGRRLAFGYRQVATVLTVALYSIFAPFGYAVFTTLSLVPTLDRDRRARRLQWVMRRAFAFMHHYLRVVRILDFNPRALHRQVPDGACVLIANHPTLTDVTAIMGAVENVCTAVKPQLYRQWWLHPLLAGARQFSATPNPLAGDEMLNDAEQCLRDGFRVLIFPEGTRSPRGGLHPFGRSAFELACRANIPVVAILIQNDPPWLAKGDSVLRAPEREPIKRLTVLKILEPRDFERNSRRMRDQAYALYAPALQPPRETTSLDRRGLPEPSKENLF